MILRISGLALGKVQSLRFAIQDRYEYKVYLIKEDGSDPFTWFATESSLTSKKVPSYMNSMQEGVRIEAVNSVED